MTTDNNLNKLNILSNNYKNSIYKLKYIRPLALSDVENIKYKQMHNIAKNDYNKYKNEIERFEQEINNKLLGNSNTFSHTNSIIDDKNNIVDILENTRNNLEQKSSGSKELYKNIELINTINIIDIILLFLIIFIFSIIYFRNKINLITEKKNTEDLMEKTKSNIENK